MHQISTHPASGYFETIRTICLSKAFSLGALGIKIYCACQQPEDYRSDTSTKQPSNSRRVQHFAEQCPWMHGRKVSLRRRLSQNSASTFTFLFNIYIMTISQAAYLQKRLTVLLIEAMHLSNRNFRCASPAFLLGQVRTRADVDASSNISPQCQGKSRENLHFKSKMCFSGYP